MKQFVNRAEAGKNLASALGEMNLIDALVLALPRGGVPIGIEIVRALRIPMDLIMVRKIGVPSQPELAAAAIVNGDDPQVVINSGVARAFGLTGDDIDRMAARQLTEIQRRRQIYLGERAQVPVEGRTAIVVDDGIATGATVRASLKGLKRRKPARILLAVPVAPQDTLAELRGDVNDIICLETPEPFWAIGAHYSDFSQTSDEEVVQLLDEANAIRSGGETSNK
ncbi:phosphoribosyltransferase [Ruegeria sediminis]|uniref:Phosphoribosyltransferase n=1 Tax=Ruegeria sediminis TaxID=2583820 RepID=A0ABY2X0C7_9RHOB|nr:phosphoribosyltransferase [Ruegeria sediminis]TMV08677.1 phosphoribosyltransferase [Ruegeria sediminis]